MSQVTKESILQSASKLFGNRTPSAVSLREIAKEANVSKSLILKYWGSRTGFVIAVLEHERYKIRDVWEGVDRDTSVQEICIRLLTAFQANPRYFNLITRVALEDIDPKLKMAI